MLADGISPPLAEITATSADGAELQLRRFGNPAAPVRLYVSHGNGFAVAGYADFWRHFLADFDLVLFDMRSHGVNPRAHPGNHDYAHMVEDIDAVGRAARAEFGLKPAAGLFHSMSAQAALLQTIAASGNAGAAHFAALVLFDPPNVPPPGHPAHRPMVDYEDKLETWAAARRDRFAEPQELAAEYARTRSGRRWPADAAARMARAVLQADGAEAWALACPRGCEASMYRQGLGLGLWPVQSDVPVPVALVAADPGGPYPAATGIANRALAAEGGFAYRAIRGSSHLLQLEEPAACAAAARGFLTRFGLA